MNTVFFICFNILIKSKNIYNRQLCKTLASSLPPFVITALAFTLRYIFSSFSTAASKSASFFALSLPIKHK